MHIKKIVFATHNTGKIEEVKRLFKDLDIVIVGSEEAGVLEEVIEDGDSFLANTLKKARFVQQKTGEWTMADDSGLCVDALDGAPGVHSARWAGDSVPGNRWVEKLLFEMKDVPEGKRGAHFETSAVLLSLDGQDTMFFTGRVYGDILVQPRGVAHPRMPYDVVFVPVGYTRTFAEMSQEDKNIISHRGLAFLKLRDFVGRL